MIYEREGVRLTPFMYKYIYVGLVKYKINYVYGDEGLITIKIITNITYNLYTIIV
jgi:hypothetical protein